MTSLKKLYVALVLSFMVLTLPTGCDSGADKDEDPRLKVLLDTDANNELDDQHAMAYLFFNSDTFKSEEEKSKSMKSSGIAAMHC